MKDKEKQKPEMKRLFDRIRKDGLSCKCGKGICGIVESSICRPVEGEMPVIACDNVADYLMSRVDDKVGFLKDFPNLAPPFQKAFFEYKRPSLDLIENEKFKARLAKIPSMVGAVMVAQKSKTEPNFLVRWLPVLGKSDGPFCVMRAGLEMEISPDGAVVSYGGITLEGPEVIAKMVEDNVEGSVLSLLTPFFMAVNLMHCKNVTMTKNRPSLKFSKAHERRGGKPLVSFSTINIGEFRKLAASRNSSGEETGIKRALHIARGHFATYTEDKKLFGKVAGTFWIPQHVRGNSEAGIVKQKYMVKSHKT